MTHITQQQRQQIADLRSKGVSFVKISQQTGIPMGTAKTIFYKDRPPSPPPTRTKTGQLKSRSSKGRKPENGKAAQSDKARAAACRARKRERMVQLAGDLGAATDAELAAILAQAIRTGDSSMVKGIVIELHTRHCAKRGSNEIQAIGQGIAHPYHLAFPRDRIVRHTQKKSPFAD